MFIDSHAHLTSEQLLAQAKEIVARAKRAEVEWIINICTDQKSLEEGLKLQNAYVENVRNTAATTPHDVEKEGELFFPIVAQHAKNKKIVAIGETGLDYFYEHSPKAAQQHYLSKYLELAKIEKLPVIFHCRDAFADLFSITDEQYANLPALMHCFTGNLAEAKSALDRGWHISFSGIITFKKSQPLRDIVKYVPLDRLLIETDSPYLAPESKRGQANEPAFVLETAETVAKIKGLNLSEVGKITAQNARNFFSLKS